MSSTPPPAMPLAQQAARGALWTMLASIGGRAIGLVGTLWMTRLLEPDAIGEVTDATILCMTANVLTTWGFGQYAIVRGHGEQARDATWHATVAYIVLGVVSFAAVVLAGAPLARVLHAPHAALYVPGMALAALIRRFGAMPERVLTRRLSFRASGSALLYGEIVYTVTAVGLAALHVFRTDRAGLAIVVGNIVQSLVVVAIFVRAAGVRSWATPSRLSWTRVKDMLRYGLPLGFQGFAQIASTYWDNLAVSRYFGAEGAGVYNLAYNLADIPATQVGEQVALVLLPSLAELPRERRPAALERASALLGIAIFPLAIGLGLIARPLVAMLLPADRWQGVAPLLQVLAAISVVRPMSWIASIYLQAEGKTGRLAVVELGKTVVLIGGIVLLAPLGLRVASSAVGIAFAANAIVSFALVAREGPSAWRLLVGFVRPLAAGMVMAAAVWLTGRGLAASGWTRPSAFVAVEVTVGAVVYIAAIVALAREGARDVFALLRGALHGAVSAPSRA